MGRLSKAQVTLCRSGGPDLYDLKNRRERHGRLMRSWQHRTDILEVCSVGKRSAVIGKPVRQSFIPPFHWATIRSRSKPIWKSGPIGNKRELNGSDRKLSGNQRQRSGMVGKVGGDLWTCSKIAPDLRGSGTERRSSVRSVSRSSLIVSWSYESGTQRVFSGCRISPRSHPL